jgi:hypothetical protein
MQKARVGGAASIVLVLACAPARGGRDGGPPTGEDGAAACYDTAPYCAADAREVLVCDAATGRERVVEACVAGTACIDGRCREVACVPGQSECLDDRSVGLCRPDGSGWDSSLCGQGEHCAAERGSCVPACELRVLVLLDRSSSMGGLVSPTKWDEAREALAALLADPAVSAVEWGLGVFPSGGGDCETSRQIVLAVPEATREGIDGYFASNGPDGDTPLLEAYGRLLDTSAAGLDDPAYQGFVLLVSDGADTCHERGCEQGCGLFDAACVERCEGEAAREVVRGLGETAARLRDEHGVRTFVIGFGSGVSADELSAIARNGGTAHGQWLEASDVDQLVAAFDEIAAEMLECTPIE